MGPEFDAQPSHTRAGCAGAYLYPSAGEAKMGRSLGFAGQLV